MNKKILGIIVVLMAIAMLATPMVGISWAAKKFPTIVDFDLTIQVWPDFDHNLNPPARMYFNDEGDYIMRNLRLYGEPPLVDVLPPAIEDLPDGGIRLTMDDGVNEYTLIGTFVKYTKINIFYDGPPPATTDVYGLSKWSFTITEVESVASGTAPDNAEGSTMKGWVSTDTANNVPMTYVSTKGTGMFHGASVSFVTIAVPYLVGPNNVVFTSETATGQMQFP